MNNSVKIQSVNNVLEELKSQKIAHLTIENDQINDAIIRYDNKSLVNFGSCSYLGLELCEELKQGAINAIERYGTQYSSSRAYSSLPLYQELEELLVQIFKANVLVFPSTTLTHQGALPVLIGKADAVILDHQVHTSVQTASQIVKASGTHVELVRHNRMDLLELRIQELSKKKQNIWYLADGVYSMFGDVIPMNEINTLLEKYPNFHVYVDDAHGMSVFGSNGQGYVLSQGEQHERLIVSTSFAKAFGTGGGVLVSKNNQLIQKVKNCASTFITSGPLQPGTLGAACASAKIHLTEKIQSFQQELRERIEYVNFLLEEKGLPNLSESQSPIFFIAAGVPEMAMKVIEKMKGEGFALNIGVFPAVPMKNAGIRFTINRLHTFSDLKRMVEKLGEVYFSELVLQGKNLNDVFKLFKLKNPFEAKIEAQIHEILDASLSVKTTSTILDVCEKEWNMHLGKVGMLSWQNMNVLENSFNDSNEPENNWRFEYLTILDQKNEVVLQTFATSSIMKDDMLSSKNISDEVERIRQTDKYAKTSVYVTLGTLVTEGKHLYLNQNSQQKNQALKLMFEWLDEIKARYQATTIMLRDFHEVDSAMSSVMFRHGFIKQQMPLNYTLDLSKWDINESYKTVLSKRSKRHFKENVERSLPNFNIHIHQKANRVKIQEYYQLYLQVHAVQKEINTYALPYSFFQNMAKNKEWEMIELQLKNSIQAVGVVFLHLGQNCANAAIVGLDYSWSRETNAYRQIIYQVIHRSKQLGYNEVRFGYSAGTEKKKFGASEEIGHVYLQIEDALKLEELEYLNESVICVS